MKFSIRDLLLVTMIMALAVGWWIERRQRIQVQRELGARKVVSRERERDLLSELGAYKNFLRQQGFRLADEPLPTSSVPAPNPPKP